MTTPSNAPIKQKPFYKHEEIIIGHFDGSLFRWYANYIKQLLTRLTNLPVYLREIIPENESDYRKISAHCCAEPIDLSFSFHTNIYFSALKNEEIDIMAIPCEIIESKLPYPLSLAAVLGRVAHRECLISRGKKSFSELKSGDKVGVYSSRQKTQLDLWRTDLEYSFTTPDLETLISVKGMGEYEAVVFPEADIKRLGYEKYIAEIFPEEIILPALRQSVIGCVTRNDNTEIRALLGEVSDKIIRDETLIEEGFLANFNPPFDAPIGGRAIIDANEMRLWLRSVNSSRRSFEEEFIESKDNDPFEFGAKCAYAFEKKGGRSCC